MESKFICSSLAQSIPSLCSRVTAQLSHLCHSTVLPLLSYHASTGMISVSQQKFRSVKTLVIKLLHQGQGLVLCPTLPLAHSPFPSIPSYPSRHVRSHSALHCASWFAAFLPLFPSLTPATAPSVCPSEVLASTLLGVLVSVTSSPYA